MSEFVKVSGDAIIRRSEIVAVEIGSRRQVIKGWQYNYRVWTKQHRKYVSEWTDDKIQAYTERLLAHEGNPV